jgi:hypothetical protein
MEVVFSILLSVAASLSLVLGWYLTKRLGLIAALFGAVALFGASFGLPWLAPILGVREPEGSWNLSVLGYASLLCFGLGWCFVVGCVGGIVKGPWTRRRKAPPSEPSNAGPS